MIKWTKHPEMVQFLMEYIPGHTQSEIRNAFNDRFGIFLTIGQLKSFQSVYQVRSGTIGGRFYKGQPSPNKGKKMDPKVYEKVKRTMFKKGSVPHNHREVGSERITVDGYIEVKIAEPSKWEQKQRVVWKQHFGEIKEDECITFLDGNTLNCDISNLRKITRAELVRYNQDGFKTDDPELNEVALNIAKLKTIWGKKTKGDK